MLHVIYEIRLYCKAGIYLSSCPSSPPVSSFRNANTVNDDDAQAFIVDTHTKNYLKWLGDRIGIFMCMCPSLSGGGSFPARTLTWIDG